MSHAWYQEFLTGSDTLRVYADGFLVFSSRQNGLLALLDYLAGPAVAHSRVLVMDKVEGNAAALLTVKAGGHIVYSPLGSEAAGHTLSRYGVLYHFDRTVPYILRPDGKDLCPMEKLSLDKEPEQFHRQLQAFLQEKVLGSSTGS